MHGAVAEAERLLHRGDSQMTTRHAPPPPIRQDPQHRHARQNGLADERDAAERHTWDALARYKFVMFGYWCGIWGPPQPPLRNPETQSLERARGRSRRHRRRHDENGTTQPGRP